MHLTVQAAAVNPTKLWIAARDVSSTFGHFGVDVFFVISGLIMFRVLERGDTSAFTGVVKFIINRAARIYPIYWLSLLAMWLVVPGLHIDVEGLLLYSGAPEFGVIWTLLYEVRFYFVIATIILLPAPYRYAGLFVWCVIQSLLIIFALIARNHLVQFIYLSPLMLEFVFGIGVAALLSRKPHALVSCLALAASVGALVASAMCLHRDPAAVDVWRLFLFGIPAALLVYAIVGLDSQLSPRIPSFMVTLGDASYSIYMWHLPVILTLRYFWQDHLAKAAGSYVVTSVFVVAVLSVISFKYIERPSMRMVRYLSTRMPVLPAFQTLPTCRYTNVAAVTASLFLAFATMHAVSGIVAEIDRDRSQIEGEQERDKALALLKPLSSGAISVRDKAFAGFFYLDKRHWYAVEEFGVWSRGESSIINFIMPQHKTCKMEFLGDVFGGAIIDAYSGGRLLAKGKRPPVSLDIAAGERLSSDVTFAFHNVRSPEEAGIAPDPRKLAFGLREIIVDCDDHS